MDVNILDKTIVNPISFTGECAGIAYDSYTADPQKNSKRGKQCIKDGHFRMLEFCDVYMRIDGYSCRVIREFARHVGDGLTMIQSSNRYCNENNFEYYTPPQIANNPKLNSEYKTYMEAINSFYQNIIADGVSVEDAANLLPLGMNTTLAIKKNARNLMDMAAQRLCSRAYVEYRRLMYDILSSLSNYSEEWAELCEMIMLCKCDKVGWCEEHQSCGRYPKKDYIMVVDFREKADREVESTVDK